LRELDFDLQTGKMSEADYADLSERYKRRAVGLLKQLDDRQRDVLLALDDEIEREVEFARKARKSPVAVPTVVKCASCGAALENDDQFCRRCGAHLDKKCPVCGSAAKSDDRHCARCGRALG
jgi:predicted nucleic acid-binding Zn ribbon protein